MNAVALALPGRLARGNTLPILVVSACFLAFWYAAAIWMNAGLIAGRSSGLDAISFAKAAWSLDRPLLPAPHQILWELKTSLFDARLGTPRNLFTHIGVTLSSTLVGFAIGVTLGILLAIGVDRSRALDKSLTPWLVASQTIPILAIAPIVVTALGSVGLKGLIPKAIISAYLCFFPVAIGMAKGLASPDSAQRDLMRTYAAGARTTLTKLQLPASLPFLFASLKVAAAAAFVGAIVAELPTGAQSGLGARLLAGSYYGNTMQIWAALIAAALTASLLVGAVTLIERLALGPKGARR
ncbi:ABC transporter permease [Hansschlegelia quercus]|uniref:ABC transporter permease subunit n=1 Tax=Hansschlegelia quercus TaxID=2528245 RepID=A0A4Q9GP17_9HYPH|nr:ABC transporter permease subunit [Hansschlegelia quercus]TBN55271.1 ABC transporter permease subunit [Hansschlegelia quercus]